MDVTAVTPIPVLAGDEPWLPGFLRAALLRLHFARGLSRDLGWRGLRPSSGRGEGLTLKVRGLPGVFGLLFEGEEREPGGVRGSFSLNYFPDPDEPRAETLPLAALALTQAPDYWDLVREFAVRPDMRALFHVGRVRLAASAPGDALGLGLTAHTRQRLLALDGVALPAEGGPTRDEAGPFRYLIEPGGIESDVPALALAQKFFRVLAASLARVLGEAPALRRRILAPGLAVSYGAEGILKSRPDPALRRVELDLWFGARSPDFPPDPPVPDALGLTQGRNDEMRGPFRHAARRWLPPGPDQGQGSARPDWPGTASGGADCAGANGGLLGLARADGPVPPGERPELLVLTGFLGAGKTTLLRRFLEYNLQRDRYTAVIQNEIGAVGVDGRLVDDEAGVLEMDEGCVCCTLAGQLRRGLSLILSRFRPDLVVLETTGLANPRNLLDELDTLRDLVRPGVVVTVADAANFEEALAESEVARDQAACADILVLNKTDLATPDQVDRAREILGGLSPRALLLEARHGDVPFAHFGDPDLALFQEPRPLFAPAPSRHGATHLASGFSSRTLDLPDPVAAADLLPALRRASRAAFRIKGVVDLDRPGQPRLVQCVAGRMEIGPLPGSDPGQRFLVFIGRPPLEEAVAEFRRGLRL
jgi:G3E family GTPase